MTDAKHTPGPWMIDERRSANSSYKLIVTDCEEKTLALTERFPKSGISWVETSERGMANARLIAAAPELLSAGANILTAFETLCKAQNINMYGNSVFAISYRNLLSAIARATGKEQ